MAGPLYKSLHFSYSNRRTNPNPLRPAQILQRHATVCVSDSVGTEAFKKFYKEEFLMRNLKKVLSLVLCVAMMLSVMVVGAGAAFSDQSKIKNTEAVDACTALNIIGGYPDGSFKPEGNITRAEVTKMICVALNGGKEPNLATNATPTFSDVRTNANSAWAEKYIESCASQGIVSGVGGGKFAPAGNVTGTQLAKMLLVSLGYKSENEGFTGNAWATNVNTVASAKGLYAGLETIDPSAAITRDNAAQMVWNAMNAYEVEYKTSLIADKDGKLSTQITVQDKVVGSNNDKITLLEDKYEAKAITGTLTAVKQDNGKTTYNITIQDPQYKGEKYNNGKDITYTDVAKDYSSLKYQNVRVLVKPSKNGKDAVVYGVYATSKNTIQTGLLADLKKDSDKKVKLDGTKYDLATSTKVYVDGEQLYMKDSVSSNTDFSTTKDATFKNDATINAWVTVNGEGNATYKEGTSVKLLATDGSSDYSILEVTTYSVSKVTYVGSDYVNTEAGKRDSDDYVIASGLKKDDYVVVTKAGNYADKKGRVEKATIAEGKVVGTKGSDKVQIGNDWYTMATGVTQPTLNSSVKLILVNGYAYDKDTISAGTEDVALLVELGQSNTVGSKYYQARMIFSDGTDKVVDVEKKDGNNVDLVGAREDFTKYKNDLVTYDVSKNVYTLTVITNETGAKAAGYDTFKKESTVTIDGSMRFTSNYRAYLEDTAPVFVAYKNGDYKVVSGKTVAAWKATTASWAKALITKDNTTNKASVAFVNLTGSNVPGGSDTTYAVALDGTYTQKIDGTTYYFTKAWNGKEEVTYKSEDTVKLAKGDVFEYSADGTDTVSVDKVTMTKTQVKTYSNGDISFKDAITYTDAPTGHTSDALAAGEIREIDSKDTVVLYVDSDKNQGVGSGEIRVGNAYNSSATDTDKPNVSVNLDYGDASASDGHVTVIVVDVNNNYNQW